MSKIRVVIIEDHDLSRIGLQAALSQSSEIDVVGCAENGRKGLGMMHELKPDVAVVDIGLPDIDGIEIVQRYKGFGENGFDHCKILMLTMNSTEEAVMAAFAAGADSYSLKDVSMDNLVQAIQSTFKGDAWIDPAIARVVLKQSKGGAALQAGEGSPSAPAGSTLISAADPEVKEIIDAYPLTEREHEVLQLIVGGCNNNEIAEKLYITVGTVKTHVRNILNKLCADDRTQAAVRALRSGLVS